MCGSRNFHPGGGGYRSPGPTDREKALTFFFLRFFVCRQIFLQRESSPPLDPSMTSLIVFVHKSSWPQEVACHSFHRSSSVGAEVLCDWVLLFSNRICAWGIKRCVD